MLRGLSKLVVTLLQVLLVSDMLLLGLLTALLRPQYHHHAQVGNQNICIDEHNKIHIGAWACESSWEIVFVSFVRASMRAGGRGESNLCALVRR